MTTDDQLIQQLQKINYRLDQLTNKRKIIGREFMSGIFRSLGTALGTILIILISVYFLSKLDFGKTINDYIQNLIPQPVQINVPFSLPSLDQP